MTSTVGWRELAVVFWTAVSRIYLVTRTVSSWSNFPILTSVAWVSRAAGVPPRVTREATVWTGCLK
jgi:hypothetical protein